jgi:hypothetical protein
MIRTLVSLMKIVDSKPKMEEVFFITFCNRIATDCVVLKLWFTHVQRTVLVKLLYYDDVTVSRTFSCVCLFLAYCSWELPLQIIFLLTSTNKEMNYIFI